MADNRHRFNVAFDNKGNVSIEADISSAEEADVINAALAVVDMVSTVKHIPLERVVALLFTLNELKKKERRRRKDGSCNAAYRRGQAA